MFVLSATKISHSQMPRETLRVDSLSGVIRWQTPLDVPAPFDRHRHSGAGGRKVFMKNQIGSPDQDQFGQSHSKQGQEMGRAIVRNPTKNAGVRSGADRLGLAVKSSG
ncbi:hypothetical protein SV7mr_48600 [Stieleria bergensis]|uniref:Uncharacterized protein n=1 Tax=Stieleria bergensis TaxID=2528025 RepID=A0A517T1S6_9BACT|nr:hypothetical protein SV7mr_48600 [Planctomycetes bacterium SV_7m_r]